MILCMQLYLEHFRVLTTGSQLSPGNRFSSALGLIKLSVSHYMDIHIKTHELVDQFIIIFVTIINIFFFCTFSPVSCEKQHRLRTWTCWSKSSTS